MESVIEQELTDAGLPALEEKLRLYLRAWNLPDSACEELRGEVMECVRDGAFADPERESIEFAQRLLGLRAHDLGIEILQPDFQKALIPQRPLETRLNTMETSLSKLPSIRIIAGWILLIVGLALAFILTH